jgi:hypothetical protein
MLIQRESSKEISKRFLTKRFLTDTYIFLIR